MNRAEHRLNGTVLCGLVCAFACGCDPNVGPPTKVSTRAETPEPIEQLPAHVHSSAGEVTLFADYDDVRGDYVVLYLVNRMERHLGFSAQDDDIYAKLEAENDLGAWERAQIHGRSGCGNSYTHMPSLRPGEFFRFLGYFPSEGEPRNVRYKVYSEEAFVLTDESPDNQRFARRNTEKIPLNLVSNTGAGRARAADIADTRRDSWAIRYGSSATVRALALDASESARRDSRFWDGPRRTEAVKALRRFPDKATAAVLETLLEDDDPSIRRRAIRVLAIIGPECSEAEMRFQQLLEDEDVNRRASAIVSLAERAVTVDIVRDMQRLLEHKEPMFRAAAVGVLMKSCKKLPEAHAVLEAHKTDPDPLVQSLLDNLDKGWCPSSRPGSDEE